MNKIEDLIKQYCPNGVEYKTIEEVCEKCLQVEHQIQEEKIFMMAIFLG